MQKLNRPWVSSPDTRLHLLSMSCLKHSSIILVEDGQYCQVIPAAGPQPLAGICSSSQELAFRLLSPRDTCQFVSIETPWQSFFIDLCESRERNLQRIPCGICSSLEKQTKTGGGLWPLKANFIGAPCVDMWSKSSRMGMEI